MKGSIKKILKIVLVAPSYIIVDDDGNNRIIYCKTDGKKAGEFYEVESPVEVGSKTEVKTEIKANEPEESDLTLRAKPKKEL